MSPFTDAVALVDSHQADLVLTNQVHHGVDARQELFRRDVDQPVLRASHPHRLLELWLAIGQMASRDAQSTELVHLVGHE